MSQCYPRVVTALAAVALIGCGDKRDKQPVASPPDDASAVTTAAPQPPPPPPRVAIPALETGKAGKRALVNIVGKGLHRVARGKVERVVPWAAQDVAVAKDGAVFAVGAGGVADVSGRKPRLLRSEPATRAAIAADGTLWVADRAGVSRFDRAANSFGEPKPIGLPGALRGSVRAMAFDDSGVLWIVTAETIFQMPRADGLIVAAAAPVRSAQPQYKAAISQSGALYIGFGTGVLRVKGGALEPVDMPGNHFYSSKFVLLGDGTIAAVGKKKVLLAHPAGRRSYLKIADHKQLGAAFRAAGGGPSGRLWVATDSGLFAVTPVAKDAAPDAVAKVERVAGNKVAGASGTVWVLPARP